MGDKGFLNDISILLLKSLNGDIAQASSISRSDPAVFCPLPWTEKCFTGFV